MSYEDRTSQEKLLKGAQKCLEQCLDLRDTALNCDFEISDFKEYLGEFRTQISDWRILELAFGANFDRLLQADFGSGNSQGFVIWRDEFAYFLSIIFAYLRNNMDSPPLLHYIDERYS